MYYEMVKELYDREYALAKRAHGILENGTSSSGVPVAPYTYEVAEAEADEAVDEILRDKQERLLTLLRRRRS